MEKEKDIEKLNETKEVKIENSKKKGNGFLKFVIVVLLIIISGLVGWMIGSKAICLFDSCSISESEQSNSTNTNENEQNNINTNTNTNENTNTSESGSTEEKFIFDPNSSDIAKQNGYGKIKVRGYAYTEKVTLWGETVNYVFFKVGDSSADNWVDYLEKYKDNSFAKDDAIGLGCIKNGVISWSNFSDDLGYAKFSLTKEDTSKIMNTSEEKRIILNLNKFKISDYGKEVDLCYSHMTKISIDK